MGGASWKKVKNPIGGGASVCCAGRNPTRWLRWASPLPASHTPYTAAFSCRWSLQVRAPLWLHKLVLGPHASGYTFYIASQDRHVPLTEVSKIISLVYYCTQIYWISLKSTLVAAHYVHFTNGAPIFNIWSKSREVKLPCTKLQWQISSLHQISRLLSANQAKHSKLELLLFLPQTQRSAGSTDSPETTPPSVCPSSDHQEQGRGKKPRLGLRRNLQTRIALNAQPQNSLKCLRH